VKNGSNGQPLLGVGSSNNNWILGLGGDVWSSILSHLLTDGLYSTMITCHPLYRLVRVESLWRIAAQYLPGRGLQPLAARRPSQGFRGSIKLRQNWGAAPTAEVKKRGPYPPKKKSVYPPPPKKDDDDNGEKKDGEEPKKKKKGKKAVLAAMAKGNDNISGIYSFFFFVTVIF
jgi:hypothetical protein